MDKKLIGLVGAMAVLSPVAGAAAQELPAAASYGDLLRPIPNAGERLKAMDAALVGDSEAKLDLVEYRHHHYRYHHHHHHHSIIRRLLGGHHHHHHHHHHF